MSFARMWGVAKNAVQAAVSTPVGKKLLEISVFALSCAEASAQAESSTGINGGDSHTAAKAGGGAAAVLFVIGLCCAVKYCSARQRSGENYEAFQERKNEYGAAAGAACLGSICVSKPS